MDASDKQCVGAGEQMTNQEKRKAKLPDGEPVDFHMFFVDKDGNPPYALGNQIQIFAIDLKTNERFEIDDLYFFEEEGIHIFRGVGHNTRYIFEVFVGGIMVYRSLAREQK